MTAEQFCLRWNNHQSTLVSVFDGLFESGTLVDCTLAADGQFLKAHKVVLCACSPYLEMLLSQHYYNQHPIVILKDVKFEELQALMEYMYRGEVNVTQEQLGRFLKAAELLQVKGLTNSEVDRSGSGSAQIVSSASSAVSDAKDVCAVKSNEAKKKSTPSSTVVATSVGINLVDTLKLTPSNLVIDIPPISPVNIVRERSVSPNPRKRKKFVSQQSTSEVKSAKPNSPPVSECATNINNNNKSVLASSSKYVLEVDPMDVANSHITSELIKEEDSDDSYGSEGNLVVDEDFDADDKTQPEPGPSNTSGAVADGCTWKALTPNDDEHPESTKDFGALAAAMSLARTTAALRAVAQFDSVRERERERPFVCERCGRHYSVSYTLDRHKKYECGVDKQFFCRKCFRPFSRADSMRVHMKNCLAKELLPLQLAQLQPQPQQLHSPSTDPPRGGLL